MTQSGTAVHRHIKTPLDLHKAINASEQFIALGRFCSTEGAVQTAREHLQVKVDHLVSAEGIELSTY